MSKKGKIDNLTTIKSSFSSNIDNYFTSNNNLKNGDCLQSSSCIDKIIGNVQMYLFKFCHHVNYSEKPYGIKMLTRQLKVDHQKGLPAYLKLWFWSQNNFVAMQY